jgi:hypothetical protein
MYKLPKSSGLADHNAMLETRVALERLGVVGYLGAKPSSTSLALETLASPQAAPQPGLPALFKNDGKAQPETTIILKKDGRYYVYLHVSQLTTDWWVTNLNAFTQWAMSLSAEDVIYLHQNGALNMMPGIVQAMVVLDTLCKARKIFVVDHIIETPVFALISDELEITDTGALTFTSCIRDDARKAEKVFMPYLTRLFARAVKRKLLTADEAKSVLENNAIIFKTARQLLIHN